MTRERAKELLPIFKAFSEGKKIEFLSELNDSWSPSINPNFFDDFTYRIKPESKYIPFTFEDRDLFMGRRIKGKISNGFEGIIDSCNFQFVFRKEDSYTYEEALSQLQYHDGTPFGKLES